MIFIAIFLNTTNILYSGYSNAKDTKKMYKYILKLEDRIETLEENK